MQVHHRDEHVEAVQGFHAGWRRPCIGGAESRHGLCKNPMRPMDDLQTQ
jgi:lactaldehyde dehydrogenase / glycolaldehyde dehydrogenase